MSIEYRSSWDERNPVNTLSQAELATLQVAYAANSETERSASYGKRTTVIATDMEKPKIEGGSAGAITAIERIATELTDIHRAKEYSQWRLGAASELSEALAATDPFRAHVNLWVFTGDGGGMVLGGRFGKWVIDQLAGHATPQAIIELFEAEVARNVATYVELTPLFGIALDAPHDLGDGIMIEPPAEDFFARTMNYLPFQRIDLPNGTALLSQRYSVTPAFAPQRDEGFDAKASKTVPASSEREAVRRRLRLACLLAGNGAVEMPISAVRADRDSCLVAGAVSYSGRPFTPHPLVSLEVTSNAIATLFQQLGTFKEVDSLARAVDRLGRSRLAVSDVDKAIELGMAAEIALMHDHSPSNTEITYKIGSRAAWLLGNDTAERAAIFDEMRHLYQARSAAVHSGSLSAKSKVDLIAADFLVARVLSAIAERGSFPDWASLTMGGGNTLGE